MTRRRLMVIALMALLLGAVAVAAFIWVRKLRAPAPELRETPLPPAEPALELLEREMARLRRGGKTLVPYRPGSPEELADYRAWIDAALQRALGASASAPAVPSGFRSLALPGLGELLGETLAERRGAGALVLREGEARTLLIEVPHSFFDEGTLEIGYRLFSAARARALLVNTVHRNRARTMAAADGSADDDDDGSSASDLAHADNTFFLTAHATCVDAVPTLQVIQLHGFSDSSARGVDAVLSAARSSADPRPLAAALRGLGLQIAIYPTDIRRLGGTQNRQARYSIAASRPFLHVEMSSSLRERLTSEPELMQRFLQAVLGSIP